jgi:hypothetical protein
VPIGRLIVTQAKKMGTAFPGAVYRLLAAEPGAQFAELLAVLGLSDAVDAGGSRCGICNGDEWRTLRSEEVEPGQVPAAVLKQQKEFYKCGKVGLIGLERVSLPRLWRVLTKAPCAARVHSVSRSSGPVKSTRQRWRVCAPRGRRRPELRVWRGRALRQVMFSLATW